MSRILITGSADGLGLLAAKKLSADGHSVVIHARNRARANHAAQQIGSAENIVIGDLSDVGETINLADQINKLGTFDAVIHNAGVYQAAPDQLFRVNTLAPYLLTSLVNMPQRLIYLSSGMHLQGRPSFEKFSLTAASISYSDTKLHVVMLAKAVAARMPSVYANAVDPGWVPTKMGGRGAPGDLTKGYETQVWLATSNDENARVSGQYFHHLKNRPSHIVADDPQLQNELLLRCQQVTGVVFPIDKK